MSCTLLLLLARALYWLRSCWKRASCPALTFTISMWMRFPRARDTSDTSKSWSSGWTSSTCAANEGESCGHVTRGRAVIGHLVVPVGGEGGQRGAEDLLRLGRVAAEELDGGLATLVHQHRHVNLAVQGLRQAGVSVVNITAKCR